MLWLIDQLDERQRWRGKGRPFKLLPPLLELMQQSTRINVLKPRTEWLEFRAALFQQRAEARAIAACMVMESRGHLDEPVQKCLAITCCFQPDSFERLVGLKVPLRVEETDAFQILQLHTCPFRQRDTACLSSSSEPAIVGANAAWIAWG